MTRRLLVEEALHEAQIILGVAENGRIFVGLDRDVNSTFLDPMEAIRLAHGLAECVRRATSSPEELRAAALASFDPSGRLVQ